MIHCHLIGSCCVSDVRIILATSELHYMLIKQVFLVNIQSGPALLLPHSSPQVHPGDLYHLSVTCLLFLYQLRLQCVVYSMNHVYDFEI